MSDLKSVPISHKDLDYISHLEDEVALEGLDGITVEGLWLRLSMRPNFVTYMSLDNDPSKEFLWSLIVQDEEIEFFCLPEPRLQLTIFNRYEYIDDEVGLVVEPKEDTHDVYPCVPVEDKERRIRGSCATYNTRENITDNVVQLSLGEVLEKYGNQLVLVGSQALRNKALSINAAVDKFYDLRTMQYVMLERIGRSRTMGEITYGKNSLAVMQIPPKTMFYHRKRLLKLNLITKQTHRQRSIKGNLSSSSLLHLARFYVRRRPKFIIMIQKIMEILQKKRDFTCTVAEIKDEIGLHTIFSKKIFKSLDFMKHIQIVNIPYRDIYPNATVKEWKFKAKNEERTLRCLQLVNPDMSFDDELPQGEEEEEMDEYESSSGILDQSNVVYGRSLLQQAYLYIRAAGPEGVTQMELSKVLGVSKLDSRTLCRSLLKRTVTHSLMKDIGKQRVTKFVSNKYASTGHLLQEFEAERKKMLEIVEDSEQNVGGEDEEEQQLVQYQASTPSTSRIMDTGVLENVEVGVEVSSSQPETFDLSQEESTTLVDNTSADHMDNGEVTITQSKSLVDRKKIGKCTSNGILATPERTTYKNQKKVSPHLTTRMIKRANIIIDAVNKFKVIDDSLKLQKMIINAEHSEGVEGKMDKKSLTRLLDRLATSGYLQKIEVKIQVGERSRVITFVLHSSINKNSKLLQMAILQQKHKFMVQVSSSKRDPQEPAEKGADNSQSEDTSSTPSKEMSVKDVVKQEPSVGFSVLEMEKMHNIPKTNNQIQVKNDQSPDPPAVSIKGNVGPKFVRMQEFHKLLFYLVYGYEGKIDLDQKFAWQAIIDSAIQDLSSESMKDYPPIYISEVSWKMFIPPLPKHTIVTVDGWVFIVDVLLRLPLSIFVQVVRIVGESNLLTSYLNHPIKQNLLVKDLPPDLRRCILNNRRYVTYVLELCNRLCYVGLLQKGPQIMKDKDQLFVYLNKKATLIDTTISNPGYHHISLDKEYVRKEYTFYKPYDVIQYWYDMWTICMHTPLGGHMCVQGKKITIQVLHKKPEMIESIAARTFEEAPERDTGYIPGDERGAAGLDSAMFSHLKRNWSCLYARFNTITQTPITPSATDSKSSDAMFSYAQYLRDSSIPGSGENSVVKNKLAGVRNVRLSIYKPKLEEESKSPLPISVGLVDVAKKRKKEAVKDQKTVKKSHGKEKEKTATLREIKVREKAPKKPYYDEEDKAALRRMDKLRVDWNGAEDCILLLCKVTSAYMFPMKRAQIISFSVIRDLLHSRYPESRNKTSKACQRRISYIMKNPATEEQVAVLLEELKQDEEITKKFKPAKLSYKKPVLHKLYVNTFKELVRRLITKYASNESKNTKDLPDSYAEFENKFKVTRASVSLTEGPKLRELTSVSDIDHFVVHALIFSSLCTKQDRESWAYQLYLAYQKYPQKLLNTVLTSIRESKMISYKKCYNRSKYIRTCLPLSTSPFQLSLSYIYVFNMKYPYEIFRKCWEMTKKILESKVEALPRCTLQLPDKSEDCVDQVKKKEVTTSSECSEEPVIQKPTRNRKKPPKIGARAKTHRTRQKQQQQQLSTKHESHTESSVKKMQEYLDTNLLELEEKGVQFSNTLVGGGCAAILSLAAIKRLSFDITIPDQLIAIDNQNREKDEGRSKLLEKIEYHEMVSGRKFALSEELNKTWFSPDEDIYTERGDSVDPIPRDDQNSSPSLNDPNSFPEYFEMQEHVSPTGIKRKHREENNDIPSKKTKSLAFDLPEEDGSSSCQAENEGEKDINQRRKQHSQSRIRMYMMREQMGDLRDHTSEPGSSVCHGVFDNIFINTCKVSCKLRNNQNEHAQRPVPAGSAELAEVFMPITRDLVNKALIARKRVVLSSWTKLEAALSEWKSAKRDSKFLNTVKKLYGFIEERKELGASVIEIKEEFSDPKLKIMKVLHEIEEIALVLRVGVDTFRWVVIQNSKPWLIRTNKMSRAKMNSTDAIRLSGVYDVDEGAEDEPKPKRCRRLIFPTSEIKESELSKDEGNEEGNREREPSTSSSAEPKRRSARTNIALLKKSCPKDAETPYSVPDIDHNQITEQYEEIDVLVRPWVRLNGCLNRRVMDRMLGSVLCHVIDNPGISGCVVAKKFWPAVQPAHTYELLETLLTIKAVKRMSVQKMCPDSLFADEQDFDVGPVDDIDFDDNFSYEAAVDCVLKLAIFIGDKKYSQDFLATCR